MKMTKIALAAALAMGAASANAAGYVGFDAGWSSVDQKPVVDALGQSLANASGHTVNVVYDKSTPTGRVFAGWNVAQGVDMEVGYLKSGDLGATYTGTTAGNAAYSLTTDISLSGFDVAAVWWPSENIFLKGGAHSAEAKLSLSANVSGSTATYTTTESGSGLLVGVGYEAAVSKDINWRAAYTYYDKLGGMSEANSHNYTVGLKMKF